MLPIVLRKKYDKNHVEPNKQKLREQLNSQIEEYLEAGGTISTHSHLEMKRLGKVKLTRRQAIDAYKRNYDQLNRNPERV